MNTDYLIYKSRGICGVKRCHSSVTETCLRPASLEMFWRQAIAAIRAHVCEDVDGRIFSSDELGVYLGPYDIDIRHTHEWIAERGGDSYMGVYEQYATLKESFKVIGACDPDNDQNLPGVVAALNRYYAKNENEVLGSIRR